MNCFLSRRALSFRWATVAAAALLSCAAPSICGAQPSAAATSASTDENTRLQALFRKGVAAYEAGKDDEAVKILSEAWAIRQTYDIAAALAQAEISLKRYGEAAEHLNFGLSHFVPGDSEQTLQQMRTAFAEAKTHVATLKVSVDHDSADVRVDDRTVGVSPLSAPAFLDPGIHTLSARLRGDTVSQQLNVEAGREYPVVLKFGVAKTGPALGTTPPVSGTDDRSLVPVIIGGAVALAGTVSFIIFDSSASSDTDRKNSLKAKNGASGCVDGSALPADCAAQLDAAQSHDRNRNLAAASVIIGAAGLVSIPVYWFWPREQSASGTARAPTLRLHAAVGVGRVSIFGDF
jgi:hypothetical protein